MYNSIIKNKKVTKTVTETYILVDFVHNTLVEYKGDFYSYGKTLHNGLFNHSGLLDVRYNGAEGFLFKFESYSDAMMFVNSMEEKGIEFLG